MLHLYLGALVGKDFFRFDNISELSFDISANLLAGQRLWNSSDEHLEAFEPFANENTLVCDDNFFELAHFLSMLYWQSDKGLVFSLLADKQDVVGSQRYIRKRHDDSGFSLGLGQQGHLV